MTPSYNEYIGIFEDVYPKGYCEYLIKEFERLKEIGAGSTRIESENTPRHKKDDYQIGLENRVNFGNHSIPPFEFKEDEKEFTVDVVNMFFKGLQACYDEYCNKFSVLRDSGSIRASSMKMQKTIGGGGYHVWHAEQGSGPSSNRCLVYSLYCNSLEDKDGGETEFLYQKYRYVPKENTIVLWPAGFTHPHRGNPILTDKSKYIVTGWFNFE